MPGHAASNNNYRYPIFTLNEYKIRHDRDFSHPLSIYHFILFHIYVAAYVSIPIYTHINSICNSVIKNTVMFSLALFSCFSRCLYKGSFTISHIGALFQDKETARNIRQSRGVVMENIICQPRLNINIFNQFSMKVFSGITFAITMDKCKFVFIYIIQIRISIASLISNSM